MLQIRINGSCVVYNTTLFEFVGIERQLLHVTTQWEYRGTPNHNHHCPRAPAAGLWWAARIEASMAASRISYSLTFSTPPIKKDNFEKWYELT